MSRMNAPPNPAGKQDNMQDISQLSLCFDLDGTLVDTAPDLIRVLNEVIAKDGLAETHYRSARQAIGFGSRRLIEEAFLRVNQKVSPERVAVLQKEFLARPLLQNLGMTSLFTRIVGGDDLPRNKPHADHIFASAGHRMNKRIVMVGDGAPDSLAAKAAHVPCVLMAYGYSTVPFEHLGADVILRRFRDLPSALQGLQS